MIGHHHLRLAGVEDAASIGRVHMASWHETYTGILPDHVLAGLSVDARVAMWKRILAEPSPRTRVYVSELDREIVGFGSCGAQRSAELARVGFDAEFYAIYVLKASQGHGLGTALMAAMGCALLEEGYQAAALWVLEENEIARRFYERRGGIVVTQKEDRRPNRVLIEIAYGWSDLRRSGICDRPGGNP